MHVWLCLLQQDAGRAAAHWPATAAVRLAGHPLRVADHAVHEDVASFWTHKLMELPNLHRGDGRSLHQVSPAHTGALILSLCCAKTQPGQMRDVWHRACRQLALADLPAHHCARTSMLLNPCL